MTTEADGQRSWFDPDLPQAQHEQLAAILRERIKSRELHGRMPSLAALSREFGVSPPTVQKAIRALKDDGLVTGRKGLGMFAVSQD
jgi:DNA-binding GntR family transcriptional regulator